MIIPDPRRASRDDDWNASAPGRAYVRQQYASSDLSAEEQRVLVAAEAARRGLKIEAGE